MKRVSGYCALLLFIILFSSVVFAQENFSDAADVPAEEVGVLPSNGSEESVTETEIDGAIDTTKEIAAGAKTKVAGVTDPIVEKEITVPPRLAILFDLLSGFNRPPEDPLTVSKFLVSIMIWILLFIAFGNIINMYSVFERRTNFAIAAVMALFLSALGVVNFFASLAITLSQGIVGLKGWSAGQLFTLILMIGLILYILSQISKHMKKHDEIVDARLKGTKAGAKLAAAGATVDAFEKISKKVYENKKDSSAGSGDWTFGVSDD